MEVITIQSEAFQSIIDKLDEIEKKAIESSPDPENVWLDNQEFCQLLKISKRTAQNYRDNGIVPFSQMASKVYYRLSDVHAMLEKHHRPAFK
ncbi:MAG: helix-turn-helix domain-containing protein [Flavobacteriales bacterium]|nr:helix-turn-helix domain-containing protein [Flavobacteriales bacterium]